MLTTEDTAHRQRFMMIGNYQRISVKLCFCAIKQYQRFALFRHAHDNPAFNAVFIKGVHRLTQLKQYIVGHVNHGINGADTATAQFFFHPQRGWRFHIDAFDDATQIARAGVGGVYGNRQNISDGCCYRRDFRLNQRRFVQHSHVTGDTDDA